MEEVEKLKTEIKVLSKRISVLENRERRRNAFKGIKIVIQLLLWGAVIYALWYCYDYVTNYIPDQIESGINNLVPGIFK